MPYLFLLCFGLSREKGSKIVIPFRPIICFLVLSVEKDEDSFIFTFLILCSS